jgi:UDP-glucose 4-epimerase
MPRVLVTGGAGYIGSHTVYFLQKSGFDVVVVDDLSRGFSDALPAGLLRQVNLHDKAALQAVFAEKPVDAVVHFAAFIAVGESTKFPELHYYNNLSGTVSLVQTMMKFGVKRLVFSSTAAVYGNPSSVPILETAELKPVNPYGETKLAVEKMLRWMSEFRGLNSVVLRYFNACGSEVESGLGERHDPETHLIPLVLRAVKLNQPVTVFGTDYPTPDGSCVRDYIHVSDLASAHILALRHLLDGGASDTFNVGVGTGFSVKEVLASAHRITGKPVPHSFGPRRDGDPAQLIADSGKLRERLGWVPKFTNLDEIISSAWAFESSQP